MSFFSTDIANAATAASIMKAVDNVIINPLIAFLFIIGMVVFLWGLFEFISNFENEKAKANGKRHMVWGIVGMFIMMAVFGIMDILVSTFGLEDPNGGTIDQRY